MIEAEKHYLIVIYLNCLLILKKMAEIEQEPVLNFEERVEFACTPMLFGKWSYEGVQCSEMSLINYLSVKSTKAQVFVPYTAGKYQKKRFQKVACPITERFVNQIMCGMHRQNGKKQIAVRIFKQTMEIIHLLTGANPLEVLFEAIVQAGAREDSTRIGSGGTVRRQAVDVSPLRRVNQAIMLICKGSRTSCFRSFKSMSETLADEIIAASKGVGQSNSFAVRKKDEIERVAKGNR
jgi:small subunit ribosomal protein S5e